MILFRLVLLGLWLLAGFGLGELLAARGGTGANAAANTVSLMLAGVLTAFLLSARAERLVVPPSVGGEGVRSVEDALKVLWK